MGVNSVIFANTMAYSASEKMLTAERYQRLCDCANGQELVKCLHEFGYTGDTLDGIFSHATDEIYAYLTANSPLPAVLSVLLKKNDYHNAKVVCKCKYARREVGKELLYPYANIDVQKMKEHILNDEYSTFPRPMAQALEAVDLRFSQGDRSGRVIDSLLNKALYADVLATLGGKYAELKEIFVAEIDLINLSVALRVRKNGNDVSVFADEFIAGGEIPRKDFDCLIFEKAEKIADVFYGSKYKEIVLSAFVETEKDAFVDFERTTDDFILSLVKKYRGDHAHYMAFYGYVLARLYELKNIRIVCAGVKAGKSKEEMKAKLRERYVG